MARPWAQRTRSSTGTYSSIVCAQAMSRGPQPIDGVPPKRVKRGGVEPRVEPAQPRRLAGRGAGVQHRRRRSGAPGRPRTGGMSRLHSTAGGCSASHGSAAVRRRMNSLDLGLDQRAPAVGVGVRGQVHQLARQRARRRVGDDPLAAARSRWARCRPADRYGCVLVRRGRATPRAAGATASSTTAIFSIALTAPPSRQCGWAISAWPGRPSTVMVGRQRAAAADPHVEGGRLGDDAGVGARRRGARRPGRRRRTTPRR